MSNNNYEGRFDHHEMIRVILFTFIWVISCCNQAGWFNLVNYAHYSNC